MRKKEIQKLAIKMLAHERVLQDPDSSKDARLNAEREIQKLSDIVFEQENPLDIMSEIDIYIQERI
jgi:hypothetical protein